MFNNILKSFPKVFNQSKATNLNIFCQHQLTRPPTSYSQTNPNPFFIASFLFLNNRSDNLLFQTRSGGGGAGGGTSVNNKYSSPYPKVNNFNSQLQHNTISSSSRAFNSYNIGENIINTNNNTKNNNNNNNSINLLNSSSIFPNNHVLFETPIGTIIGNNPNNLLSNGQPVKFKMNGNNKRKINGHHRLGNQYYNNGNLHNGYHYHPNYIETKFILPTKIGEEAQNCVRFETHRSDVQYIKQKNNQTIPIFYLIELIEGILPKEILNGSKILVKKSETDTPSIILVNFMTAIKAYQASQFMCQWNERNSSKNKIRTNLIKKSLDPLYLITAQEIDQLPEVPAPRQVEIIDSVMSTNQPIFDILFNGQHPNKLDSIDTLTVLGIDIEWCHKSINVEEPNFFAVILSGPKGSVVFNLDSLKTIPLILYQILTSPRILKVGFRNKHDFSKFETQYNLDINNLEDLSKASVVMRSKPKSLRAVAGMFLKQKLPRIDLNRYMQPSTFFTDKKVEHYVYTIYTSSKREKRLTQGQNEKTNQPLLTSKIHSFIGPKGKYRDDKEINLSVPLTTLILTYLTVFINDCLKHRRWGWMDRWDCLEYNNN
ncbi:hypothetical protein DFA_08648 [Cavenderia fasciculata]|uniref:3'-5' exonuclease domain-containing protein n=1 Tax=Cavenderia fasciculata TaxID=261658 RepID=F4Q3J4_CACFS|nr:uncharacterized protein DFA_08648 [Cavenderia fasciculata]EGG17652.1 hypothetical protein DFA_08648 [Cavenderia fasciculata]|eukprot:XP_004356136.1 hypothetical protein DFA_08648 [Cavenderia fasciculata]